MLFDFKISLNNINFASKFKKANLVSLLFFILSVFFITFKGLNYGIDFKGGTLIELRTETSINISNLRELMKHTQSLTNKLYAKFILLIRIFDNKKIYNYG